MIRSSTFKMSEADVELETAMPSERSRNLSGAKDHKLSETERSSRVCSLQFSLYISNLQLGLSRCHVFLPRRGTEEQGGSCVAHGDLV